MPHIDPDGLPFPRQPAVMTPRGLVELPPEILEGGSPQCTYVSAKEAAGILYFDEGA